MQIAAILICCFAAYAVNMRLRILLSFAVASLLGGCASGDGGLLAGKSIDLKLPIYISTIRDAVDVNQTTITGSGNALQAALLEELKKAGHSITTAPSMSSYDFAVQYTRWEDRATNWSGAPDVISASSTLKPAPFGELVSSSNCEVKSSVLELAPATPERLIPDLAKVLVEKTFPKR